MAVVLALASWSVPTRSLSQSSEQEDAALSLTISGGVSLGSYEAGYGYLWTRAIRHMQKGQTLRLVTGTSAGSVNALIAAINSCRPDNDRPRNDLGWKTWVSLGFDELFDPKQVGPTSVFTRDGLGEAVENVRSVWNMGLRSNCDVVLGVSVTRLESKSIPVNEALSLPRQLEKFVVRIRGQGLGQPPTLSNYVDLRSRLPQVLVPLRGDCARQDFDRLRDLLFASSAFPLAFAPQELDYCLTHPEYPCTWCCALPTRRDPFVDGGVFDNHPLRLAADVASYGLLVDDSGQVVWNELPKRTRDESRAYKGLVYQYLDPAVTSYETTSGEQEQSVSGAFDALSVRPRKNPGAVRVLGDFLGDLVETARARELYTLAEEQPELVRDQLHVARRNFPTMSGLLGAFFGFFESKFREFDFYLGMYDAYAETIHRLDPSGDKGTREALLSALHSSLGPKAYEEIPEDWRPFACMIGRYEPSADSRFRKACNQPKMRDFHILVQVSLDRLYATCAGSEVDASRPSYPNYHCQRARDGASPPQDTALESGGSYERDDDESELHYVMRLLAEYQFEFEDLDLEPKQAQHAPIQIRRDLLEALTALSNKQPSRLQRTAMLTSGRFALNTVAYEPPKHWGYFILGTGMELGGSVLPFPTKPPNPLRLNLALQIGSVRTLVKPRVETLTFYLVGGLELEMLWWKWSQKAQPMLGIRAGYQFGIADRFTARPCTSDNALDDARNCSQPVLQPYVAFAPLERLRLQLTFTWFPQPQAFGDQRFDGLFGVGYQFF